MPATVAGNDYLANSGVLNFGVGENFKTISVTVNGDMTPEPIENFFVNLSNATNNVIVTDASGTGTILDGAGTLSFIHDIQGTAYFSPILAGEGITNFNQASAASPEGATSCATPSDTPRGPHFSTPAKSRRLARAAAP